MSMVETRAHAEAVAAEKNAATSASTHDANVATQAPTNAALEQSQGTTRQWKNGIIITRNRTIAIVAITAIFAGAILVFILFLIGSAILNAQLMARRDLAIDEFKEVQENIGKLRDNITKLENNENLEYLSPIKDVTCYGDDGKAITDYSDIELKRNCTALRALNSALPSGGRLEQERLMTYITKLILDIDHKVEIKNIRINKNKKDYEYNNEYGSGIKGIGVDIDLVGTMEGMSEVMMNFERSIRFLNWEKLNIVAEKNNNVHLTGCVSSYYLTNTSMDEYMHDDILKMGMTGIIWNNTNKDNK